MSRKRRKYKLITFLITVILSLSLYLSLLIPITIKNQLNLIGGGEIALLVLYGLSCMLLPPSFIYYFYGVLYAKHQYKIFKDPLDLFKIVFLSPIYAVNFYITEVWYINREKYKKGEKEEIKNE